MVNTINMQDMRHLNLFSQITHIQTRFCFTYNDAIIFCVPKDLVAKAIGEEGRNIRKLSDILGKKIRVIPSPRGIHDAKGFLGVIVKPVTFKELEIKGSDIIITAGSMQSKAALIGRNKRRLLEMQKVVKDFFGKDLRII